jgi:transcriptional regulator with XRE-family HTH domain
MQEPAYEAFGAAIASVMDLAGVTTVALAERLRERGWRPDQSLVSKWRHGHQRPHDIDMLPDIEEICGVQRGTILRLAGYVTDETDLQAAILTAPDLVDAGRELLALTYEVLRKRSGVEP